MTGRQWDSRRSRSAGRQGDGPANVALEKAPRGLGPVAEANAKLAELLETYVIVDEIGNELDGRLERGPSE